MRIYVRSMDGEVSSSFFLPSFRRGYSVDRSCSRPHVPTSPHATVVELFEGEEAVSGLAFAFPFPCGGVCACAPARFEVTEDSGSSQQHEHGGGPECFARAGTASER